MSDLSTMYQNGMGNIASLYAGQNQSNARRKSDMDNRAAELKYQFDRQSQPLELRQKQATLDQMAAQLPGIQGQSASAVSKGVEDTSLLANKLALKLSEMSTQVGDEGMKRMGQEGERALKAAEIIKSYPPHMHKDIFMKVSQQYGGDPNSPMTKGILAMPDAEFATGLQAMGEGMALASQKFVQESTHKKNENDSQERTNTADNTRAIEVARIQAESRIKAAEQKTELAMSKMSTDQKIAFLTSIPPGERTEAETTQLNELSNQRLAERTAGNPSVAPTVMGQPTNQATARDTADALFPRTPQAQAPAPAGAPSLVDLAKQQGVRYDPSKYNYRINPATGRIQEAPKK